MSNRVATVRGFTLIEVIIAIVIIGVGLTGVLLAYSVTIKSSADPTITKQLLAIAEGMMEEVSSKPFVVSTNAAAANACARDTFNDVRDYNGYTTANVCDIDGTPIAALSGYSVTIAAVTPAASPMVGVTAADVLRIQIDVTRGNSSYSLVGWRTNYAGP